jgi:hypothetical protein
MPNRSQHVNGAGQKQGIRNPGKFSPDDDEAQEADVSHAAPQDLDPQDDVEGEFDDEKTGEDEDEKDGLGARPEK